MDLISRSPGIAVANSMYIVGGGYKGLTDELDSTVEQAAEMLQQAYGTEVTIRFNSDRKSGGAFLVTSPVDAIGSNAEIGICASLHSIARMIEFERKYGEELTAVENARKRVIEQYGQDPDGPDQFISVQAHIGPCALRDISIATDMAENPWRAYVHRTMPSVKAALEFVQANGLTPSEFPKPVHSAPIGIGKHEWRIRFKLGGQFDYQWRRKTDPEWRNDQEWPTYNQYMPDNAGLPVSLKKLVERERMNIEAHKKRELAYQT